MPITLYKYVWYSQLPVVPNCVELVLFFFNVLCSFTLALSSRNHTFHYSSFEITPTSDISWISSAQDKIIIFWNKASCCTPSLWNRMGTLAQQKTFCASKNVAYVVSCPWPPPPSPVSPHTTPLILTFNMANVSQCLRHDAVHQQVFFGFRSCKMSFFLLCVLMWSCLHGA